MNNSGNDISLCYTNGARSMWLPDQTTQGLLTALTPPGQTSGGYFSGLEPRLNAETPG